MTVNIAAVEALFPVLQEPATASASRGSIRGPVPVDTIQRGALSQSLVGVVEGIRADPYWSAVYKGDLSHHSGDHSKADLALCGELARRGLTAALIDTAFRTSGLYRPKWERDDYRQNTIACAMQQSTPLSGVATSKVLLALDSGRLDFGIGAPPPRDWAVDGMLLAGKSAVLAGLGGVSKTQVALLMSLSIATGTPFAGRSAQQGKVLFLSGEEDRQEILRRVNAYIRMNKMDATTVATICKHLLAFALVGEDIRLTARIDGALRSTALDQQIISAAQAFGDVRLIVLDHVGLLHGGDFNAKEDAALTMRIINGISCATGAAVVLLAHSPKSSARDEESDASAVYGSAAFVEQARGGWVMTTMREKEARHFGISNDVRHEYVCMRGVKANYSVLGQSFWFHKEAFDEVGVLEHINLTPPTASAKQSANLEGSIMAAVRNAPGQYSKTRLRDVFSGKSRSWKASKAEVEAAVEGLLTTGQLINRAPTDEERSKYGHTSQVRAVLHVAGNP